MNRLAALLATLALFAFASPAPAAQPASLARYWTGFRRFWGEIFGSVGGVVGLVLIVGVISTIIITRGKWLK